MIKIKNRSAQIAGLFFVFAAAAAVIINSKKSCDGIYEGLCFCMEGLVPSVFPFMIIASFSVKSGVSGFLGKILDRPARVLFRISGQSLSAVLIGMLGGYPVAAKGLATLYKEGLISENEAELTSRAAVCAGSGFVVSFVGARLLGSAEIGAAIIWAQIISVLILLTVNRFFFLQHKLFLPDKKRAVSNQIKSISLSRALIESVSSASYTSFDMCAMVAVFSAVCKMLGERQAVISFLEVSNACNILSKNNNIIPLAFAVGFGGICVHFQIFQIMSEIRTNKALFFLYRIIQGLLTAGLTYTFIKTFHISAPVFSSFSATPRLTLSTSITGGVLMILTGVSLIYNLSKRGG